MPDIVVEDGTAANAAANSYISEGEFETFADNHGYIISSYTGDLIPQAMIRGRTAMDALYGDLYSGTKTHGRDQPLEWPRVDATDADDEDIAEDEIPRELKEAQCEATWQELQNPGSMLPTLARGGQIRVLKAGSVSIEYAGNASATTTFSKLDAILDPLLDSSSVGAGFMATSERV